MNTLIERFIQEILKKKDKNITEEEILSQIKKVYDEISSEGNRPIPRFGCEMKTKKEERHRKEYNDFIEYKAYKEAKKVN